MEALGSPMRGISAPDLFEAIREVNGGLKDLFGTRNEITFTLAASGMLAMEAGVANFLTPGDPAVFCVNGFFGERMANIAERYGAKVTRVSSEWGQPFEFEDIKVAVAAKKPKLLGIVYAETSTGMLNPIDGLGELAHKAGALLMVDAVTAMGGMPIEVDRHGVDYCYAGSQKSIGSPPGLAPITLSQRAWDTLEGEPRTFYMDIRGAAVYWVQNAGYHNTSSSPLIFALRAALQLVREEGLENRFDRHRTVGNLMKQRVTELGCSLSPDAEHRLPMLTLVRLPDGVDARAVISKLRSDHKIEVGVGLGPMAANHFRIGTMGHSARPECVDRVASALADIV